MSQIFISHSAKDTKPLEFLNRAFATTNVQAKHEEIEAIVSGARSALQIRADINASRAIMVILGPHAQALKHTRDWIVWESGNACPVLGCRRRCGQCGLRSRFGAVSRSKN